jgi:hypothetical protein
MAQAARVRNACVVAHVYNGAEALQDRSRRPLHSPRRGTAALEEAFVSIRRAHPGWGERKIAHVLARDRQLEIAPSTVTGAPRRHGLIEPAASEAATPWQRFEHEHPDSLWQRPFALQRGAGGLCRVPGLSHTQMS